MTSKRYRHGYFGLFALATLLSCLGCAKNPERYALEGQVTIEGDPLDRGTLVLIHTQDPQWQVKIPVRAGHWQVEAARGPIAGRYDVLVVSPQPELEEVEQAMREGGENPLLSMSIPPRYSQAGALSIEVGPAHDPHHDFALVAP